jgi:hypothetical protein
VSQNPYYGTQGYGSGGYGNEPLETLPIGYYLGLVTSQYANSKKFNKLLYVLLKKFDDVSQVLVNMDTALDLDSAVGAQLDMLGATVGAFRTVDFQPSNGVSPILDDATFRIYIKAKIATNQWDGTIVSLYPIWKQLFPNGTIVIIDNQNMTADLTLTGSFTSIIQDLITHGYIVPRPEGVLYTYLFGVLPFFGFGSSPGYIAGFDTGHWVG